MNIQFQTDIPQLLSLLDTTGDLDGYNVTYPTSDGRILSLPRPAAVKLNLLDPEPGEEISITKHRPADRQPVEWVVSLTARSEQARAAKEREQAEQDAKTRQFTEEQALTAKIQSKTVRQMPKTTHQVNQEPVDPPKGTGTYGPLPETLPGRSKRPQPIPYDVAFREIVAFVSRELNQSGEQWSEQSRQDLVSTVLISSARAGLLGVWER